MLEGVGVLEVGDERCEYCGKLLALLGADVIKVEPLQGCPSRRLPPFAPDRGGRRRSVYWEVFNTDKRSVSVDPGTAAGRSLLLRLAARSQVVLVGLDDPAEVGLAPEECLEANPTVVYVDVTPFGRSGPYASYRGTDGVVFALGGLMYISGRGDGPPQVAPGLQPFVVAGAHAAVGAVAALRRARREGAGDVVEVAAFEALAAQENVYSQYGARGEVLRRQGSQHRRSVPGRIYPCRDGFVHVLVGTQPGVWENFRTWIGRPEQLAGAEWADVDYRFAHRAELEAVVEPFFAARARADLVVEGQRHHVPVVPVLDPAEVARDPHFAARGLLADLAHEDFGGLPVVGAPWVGAGRRHPGRRAPRLGEHTDEVLRAALGLGDADVDALRAAGCIGP